MINGRMRAEVVKASLSRGWGPPSGIICYQDLPLAHSFFSLKASETPPIISRLLFRIFVVTERRRNRNKSEREKRTTSNVENARTPGRRASGQCTIGLMGVVCVLLTWPWTGSGHSFFLPSSRPFFIRPFPPLRELRTDIARCVTSREEA